MQIEHIRDLPPFLYEETSFLKPVGSEPTLPSRKTLRQSVRIVLAGPRGNSGYPEALTICQKVIMQIGGRVQATFKAAGLYENDLRKCFVTGSRVERKVTQLKADPLVQTCVFLMATTEAVGRLPKNTTGKMLARIFSEPLENGRQACGKFREALRPKQAEQALVTKAHHA